MENNIKTPYLEDRLQSLGRNELLGADFYLKDLKRLSDNATSLKECFDIHKAAIDLGLLNRNIDADMSGIVRTGDIQNLSKEEIFLGGQYGVFTKNMTIFEANRNTRPDAYMLALNQYRKLLSSNFQEIWEKVFHAELEEEKESGRNVISRLFSPNKYPSRKGTEYLSAVSRNKDQFHLAYVSAMGSEVNADKISTILMNEETKHNAVNRLLGKMQSVGRTSFRLDREAFDDWVPAITVDSTKYIIDTVEAENSTLTFIARAYDGKELSVTVGGDNHSIVTGSLKDTGRHVQTLNQADAQAIKLRIPVIASMAFVNLDWQDQMVENFRQNLPNQPRVEDEHLRGEDEKREMQDLDKLCNYYIADHFKLLFPNVKLSECNSIEKRDGMDIHIYGSSEAGDQRFVRACPQDTVRDAYWRSEATSNYGTHPNGNELLFDREGRVEAFRTSLTPPYSQKCFTSDSVYFRQDGGIDRERTVEARGKGDFPVSFTGILENIEYKLQEKLNNPITVVMKAGKGYIGKDREGFTLLDRKKNDLLNGLRFDVLTKPVNGISVGKVDGQYTLVNVNKGELVDRVMRPYTGEMTPDGWALVREKKEGMERYNYINASGEMMSSRGFDYATEFREGKASVMVGKSFCELNKGGIVTNVEITDTTTVKENKTVQIKR